MASGLRPDSAELEKMLSDSIEGFSDVFIVIDAVDKIQAENQTEDRSELLGILQRLQTSGLQQLHLLCTSRNEPDIEAVFSPLLSKPAKAAIDLSDYRGQVNGEFGLFIDNYNMLCWKGLYTESRFAEIKSILMNKANCNLRYLYHHFAVWKKYRHWGEKMDTFLNNLPDPDEWNEKQEKASLNKTVGTSVGL